MAWGCETHTRQRGRRALLFYEAQETTPEAAIRAADEHQDPGYEKRRGLRGVALVLSVAIRSASSPTRTTNVRRPG
jgi:hypothetical protein